jgi:hypothetical protein
MKHDILVQQIQHRKRSNLHPRWFQTVTYSRLAWRIIMGSRFDDWIYWHFFTITINYGSSQLMTVYDSFHSLLDHERLLFHRDEWWITVHTLNSLERRLSDESLLRVKVKVTLRLTVSQSVCLCVEPRLGLMTRYLGLFWMKVAVLSVWGALWREVGSVICQSWSIVSPCQYIQYLYLYN